MKMPTREHWNSGKFFGFKFTDHRFHFQFPSGVILYHLTWSKKLPCSDFTYIASVIHSFFSALYRRWLFSCLCWQQSGHSLASSRILYCARPRTMLPEYLSLNGLDWRHTPFACSLPAHYLRIWKRSGNNQWNRGRSFLNCAMFPSPERIALSARPLPTSFEVVFSSCLRNNQDIFWVVPRIL